MITFALFFHQHIIGAYTENPAIVQLAWPPFLVMLLNYFFALPGYVYLNATTGTGATRTVFIFQVITTIAYLFCLWGLGYCNVTLAAYWAVEYLYVILLGTQSVIYLKYKQYQELKFMMNKIYPRKGDTQTVYLNAVVKDPSIEIGDYTIYNDFVSDPCLFEQNNVLYN